MTRLSERSRVLRGLAVVAACAFVAVAAAVQRGVRIYLPSGWGLAPVGEATPLGDMLAGGEPSPDGRWIAFAAVGQGTHKAYVVGRADGKPADSAAIGRGWIGLGWSADSRTLYVSGATADRIARLAVGPDGELSPQDSIAIPGIARNKGWLAGLAVDGTDAFVAVSASDRLLKVDLTTGSVVGAVDFEPGASPYQVRRARGGGIYVSLQGAAEVAEVDAARMTVVRRLPTGRHPNDILVSGDRLFAACGNDDVVDVFDLYTGTREERVLVRPWPRCFSIAARTRMRAVEGGASLRHAARSGDRLVVELLVARGADVRLRDAAQDAARAARADSLGHSEFVPLVRRPPPPAAPVRPDGRA